MMQDSIENMTYSKEIYQHISSGSKHSREMSDVEPIMIYADEETLDGTSSRNELLQRIIIRYETNSRIINLKAGFIAFITNCIYNKKIINITHVLQNLNTRLELETKASVYKNLQEFCRFSKGGELYTRIIKRNAMKVFKDKYNREKEYKEGILKLRKVFLHQSLSKDFIKALKQMTKSLSSNSLSAPVPNKSMIRDSLSKENVIKGLGLLASVVEYKTQRDKKTVLYELISHSEEDTQDPDSTEEHNMLSLSRESEEFHQLKNMKLLL